MAFINKVKEVTDTIYNLVSGQSHSDVVVKDVRAPLA